MTVHDDMTIRMAVNGRTVRVSSRVAALAIGVPHDELLAELRSNGGDMSQIPKEWQQQARRRASETAANLNDSTVQGALRHYLEEEQR